MTRPILALFVLGIWSAALADVAVLTQHNDLARTGANLEETILNINNVNTNQFGLVFTRAVDDQVYAQPLIMTNVNLGTNGTHNIVIVATVNDSVYAYDADNPLASNAYWHVSFLGPNAVAPTNSDMTGACGGNYRDFSGNMGIVGTPVIDPGFTHWTWPLERSGVTARSSSPPPILAPARATSAESSLLTRRSKTSVLVSRW
jgi:hypothetical protein